ncbi:unnamed protein product, partial [Musa acuminata subsp. burmannicoides]
DEGTSAEFVAWLESGDACVGEGTDLCYPVFFLRCNANNILCSSCVCVVFRLLLLTPSTKPPLFRHHDRIRSTAGEGVGKIAEFAPAERMGTREGTRKLCCSAGWVVHSHGVFVRVWFTRNCIGNSHTCTSNARNAPNSPRDRWRGDITSFGLFFIFFIIPPYFVI